MLKVRDSDKYTSFFGNLVQIHRNYSSITKILDLNGNVFSNRTGIEQAFLNFHANLWKKPSSSSFSSNLLALTDDLPKLSDQDGDILTLTVTRKELYKTVLELPSGKSPGPDEFNAKFYQFFQSEIGDSLFSAIQDIFYYSTLPSSWGKTFVSLIPKKR